MRNRSLCRSAVLALLAGWFWCCLTAAAMAHAALTGASPADNAVLDAAPKTLSLSFSEPVSPLVLRLVLPSGVASPLRDFVLRDRTVEITPPAGLENGTYVLTWRVVSEDGHPVSGSTIFSIGTPSASPPSAGDGVDWLVRAALWLARTGLYIGLFLGIGSTFVIRWLIPAGQGGRRIAGAAMAIGLAATLVSAGLQGLDALGRPLSNIIDPSVWRAGLGTSFGWTVAVLSAAFLVALAGLRWNAVGRAASAVALLAGSAALALSGHASAASPQWMMRPAVFLHALTIALWVGSLVPLACASREGADAGRRALDRFARLVPCAVAVLVVAGVLLAVVQVEHPAALLSTAYGKVLLIKLALVLVLFAIVAINRWALTGPAHAGEARAMRRLSRMVVLETLVVLAILAVAATWRFTPPPRALAVAAAPPVSIHIHSAKAMAEVTINPARAGPVDVSAVILAPDFSPMEAKEVAFVFSNPNAGVEPLRRKASLSPDGLWRAEATVLPLPGQWRLRVDVLISDFELVRLQDVVEIAP